MRVIDAGGSFALKIESTSSYIFGFVIFAREASCELWPVSGFGKLACSVAFSSAEGNLHQKYGDQPMAVSIICPRHVGATYSEDPVQQSETSIPSKIEAYYSGAWPMYFVHSELDTRPFANSGNEFPA
jgi:hypothetical protein